ncbi:MAG: glycosyltransferase family 87 protein [Chloroflexota bacterium]
MRRARTYALVLIGLYVVAWVYELRASSPPVYGDNVPIGGDYIAFHAAGRLLLTGRGDQLYDRAAVTAVQAEFLNGRVPGFYDAFRNPAFAALPFVPLAGLDLVPGYLAWSLLSLAALWLAIWLFFNVRPDLRAHWRAVLVLVFAFAPVFFGLIDGENATVSLLLYVLIYRALVRNQDRQAAVWAALGLFKPQLFFVFPLVLLARRSWAALSVYVLGLLGLGTASLALVGSAGPTLWLRIVTEPESGQVLVNSWRMVSLKSFLITLVPAEPGVATGVYVAASAVLLWLLFRQWAAARAPLSLVWTFTSLVAVLVDPHLVDYDLTVLIPAGILAVVYAAHVRWWLVALYLLLVFRAQVPLVGDSAVQLSVLVLCVCAGLVWQRLRPELALRPFLTPELERASSA